MATTTPQLWATTNLGPATTTFSPAAACVSSRATHILSPFSTASSIIGYYGIGNCRNITLAGCIPNGAVFDSTVAKPPTHNLVTTNVIYNSPGLYCPSSWTTAGTIVGREGDHQGTSGAGIFAVTPTSEAGLLNMVVVAQAYVSALQPAETLIWCCPSGYAADRAGVCYSSMGPLSSYSFSNVCDRFGSRIDSLLPSTDPVPQSIESAYTVYVEQGVVALVHKTTDLPASAAQTTPNPTAATTSAHQSRASSKWPSIGIMALAVLVSSILI